MYKRSSNVPPTHFKSGLQLHLNMPHFPKRIHQDIFHFLLNLNSPAKAFHQSLLSNPFTQCLRLQKGKHIIIKLPHL